jgi:methylthioribose-1-phosphate isomerase
MKVNGTPYRSIWAAADGAVGIIDQTLLPHRFETLALTQVDQIIEAIKVMRVRGAPLIGVSGAFGLALGLRVDGTDSSLDRLYADLLATRPTAVNLRWALDITRDFVRGLPPSARADAAFAKAQELADEDAGLCEAIGNHGFEVFRAIEAKRANRSKPLNILTHCNAGWLATVDWGTALAPIYKAHDAGMKVHVWVDETRPRNQGAALTAWELGRHGVPRTLVADNAGGHLMQHGDVDVVIVGSDRTTANGDVCNKIGTYLKALAAFDNHVPFYAALPYSTIDWTLKSGANIPIEERSADEVTHLTGLDSQGGLTRILLTAEGTKAANPAFDVTPARLVAGIITERGVAEPSLAGLAALYPEQA